MFVQPFIRRAIIHHQTSETYGVRRVGITKIIPEYFTGNCVGGTGSYINRRTSRTFENTARAHTQSRQYLKCRARARKNFARRSRNFDAALLR